MPSWPHLGHFIGLPTTKRTSRTFFKFPPQGINPFWSEVRNDFSVGRRVARGLAPTPYANKFSNRLTVTAGEPAGAVILLSKRKALWLCCCICGVLLAVGADRSPTRRLLILHTNDIHDHVRAGENGIGGLAFIAGAVRQIRQERGGVLVLDAGDATEKGDLVAARTDGMITFEAMRFVGYDGVTLGNHDLVGNPRELLAKYESALGQRFLCANLLGSDGLAVFESSRLIEVNGIRVGVVGLTLAAREGGKQLGVLDLKRSGAELRGQGAAPTEKKERISSLRSATRARATAQSWRLRHRKSRSSSPDTRTRSCKLRSSCQRPEPLWCRRAVTLAGSAG